MKDAEMSKMGFGTLAIHAGQEPDPTTGAVMTPIYMTSTYAQESPGKHLGFEYTRSHNPTRYDVQECVAALEHGKRGRPTFTLIQGTIHLLGIIWDEADELVRLADLSHPRVTVDTAGLDAEATLFANRLAREIDTLDAEDLRRVKRYRF